MKNIIHKFKKHQFLFEELVKRDFKKKYKRTVLGMAWSVLLPLITLFIQLVIFARFFAQTIPHYRMYLLCGNLVFSYYNESTSQGLLTLRTNAPIFTKVNVPKYMFLLAKNVQTLINFGLTMGVFFLFCLYDHIQITWKFILLLWAVGCLLMFNVGVGLILSAAYMFFRDIQYLWTVALQLLNYLSAIFYSIDGFEPWMQNVFLLNPVYLYIRYFRAIVIDGTIPPAWFHGLMFFYAALALLVGGYIYKKYNHEFLYYV